MALRAGMLDVLVAAEPSLADQREQVESEHDAQRCMGAVATCAAADAEVLPNVARRSAPFSA